MSWNQVARTDFEHTVRSRMMWAAVGVFVLLMGIVGLSAASGDLSDTEPTEIIPVFANLGGQLLVPLVALMIGYMAIVKERRSGSLRVLFGLSHGRRDVFVGKLASRLGVILTATLAACSVAVILALALFGELQVRRFIGFIIVTVLLGGAFTAIAVGVSAAAATRMQAMGGAIGSYITFALLWHPLVAAVHYVVEGELAGIEAPAWYFFLLRLNPLEAYLQTAGSLADEYVFGIVSWPFIVENVPDEAVDDPGALLLSNRVGGEVPFFLSDWFAAIILLCWILVPAVIGYIAFERADLN